MASGGGSTAEGCFARQILIGVLTLSVCLTAAADESIRFDHLSTENGLPQSVISAITQDAQGFVWMSTQSGVARYDGHSFTTHRHDPEDPTSLSQSWVKALTALPDGTVWFGTEDSGLCSLPRKATQFRCWRAADTGLRDDRIYQLQYDPRGWLWIAHGRGVDRLYLNSGAIEPVDLPGIGEPTINALWLAADANLWIGSQNGHLLRYDPANQSTESFSTHTEGARITALVTDQLGDLWAATETMGLLRIKSNGAITRYAHDPDNYLSPPSNYLTSLLNARDGTLWIGTYADGLVRYNAATDDFTQFRARSDFGYSLQDDHVVSLYQDRGHVIWVGTFNGVHKWNPQLGNFATYRRSTGPEPGLTNNYVTAFAQRTASEIWVGTHGGLNHIDFQTGEVTAVRAAPGDPNALRDDRVFALQFDTLGGLWIGTMNGGLNYRAPGAEVITEPFGKGSPTPIRSGITSLLLDVTGTLWVGTYEAGLFEVDPIRLTANRYTSAEADFASMRILSLLQDAAGNLWIGTQGNGLLRIARDDGRIDRYEHDPLQPASLSSNIVFSIHEDRRGNLWVGTGGGGLNLWRAADRNSTTANFVRYGHDAGLPDMAIHAILSQPEGLIWFSTNAGLVRFNPLQEEATVFTATHGLQSSEFNFAAALHAKDGLMLFGGIEGFNAFHPRAISTNPHPPALALTGFTRGQTAMPIFDPQTTTPKLTHEDRIISFEYAALDFTAPHKNLYQHRLIGFDEQWSPATGERRATYTNLDPGAYQLQVRAANSDGVWSSKRLTINFDVAPPPWNTPLMRALYAVLILLLIAGLNYNYQKLRANAAAIRERNNSLRREIQLRREHELALVAEKQLNQQYLDVVEVMILLLDEQGNILRVNQKGERILGYPQRELVNGNFYSLLIPSESQEQLRRHFEHLAPDNYYESPVLTRDGELRTVAWHTARLPRNASGGAHIITSGMDMTQLRDLERRMHESQKMEALGNLARGIAHDFNNILSGIVGYTELGLADLPSTSPVATNLHRLQFSATKARELVDAILTFSRQEQHDPEHVAIGALLQEGVQLIEPMLPQRVTMSLRIEDADATVLGDASQLLQLITNLCTNAYQAMQEQGGVLDIELDHLIVTGEEPQQDVTISAGDYVRLVVSDTGTGIAPDIQPRIFDPFFTTKTRQHGTGLGLSVVHGIVRQMGGSIRLDSKPGEGSRFTVLLPASTPGPLDREALDATTVTPEQDRMPPRGSGTILFVDDELTVVHIAEQLLTRQGYRVVTADNGERALAQLENADLAIDCLITDQSMPRLRGTELAAKSKSLRPQVPIILISGGGDERNSRYVDLYLQKPYTQIELANAIHSVMHKDRTPDEGISGA